VISRTGFDDVPRTCPESFAAKAARTIFERLVKEGRAEAVGDGSSAS